MPTLAIIDKPLWDAVQAVLSENRIERSAGTNSKAPSLLTGLLLDETGERLTPTWSVKKGKRYRYYVSTSLVKGDKEARSNRQRIPAGDLELIVVERLRSLLSSRKQLLGALDDDHLHNSGHGHLIDRSSQIAEELGQTPERTRTIFTALARRVEVGRDSVKIYVSRSRLAGLLNSGRLELAQDKPIDPADQTVSLKAPIQLTRVGREMKLLIEGSDDNRSPDVSLLRVVTRAHDVHRRLAENPTLTVHDVAREQRVTPKYLYILLRLRWLAPDITTAIVNGRQPRQLSAMRLMRLTAQLPADWSAQRALLGFR
jgi:hypothetical protein